MKIQVFGSGCPNCKQLYEKTKKIAKELNIDTEVKYVEDISKMIEIGAMASPALVIDNQAVLTGEGHSEEDIKKALINNSFKKEKNHNDCCSCCDCKCNHDC